MLSQAVYSHEALCKIIYQNKKLTLRILADYKDTNDIFFTNFYLYGNNCRITFTSPDQYLNQLSPEGDNINSLITISPQLKFHIRSLNQPHPSWIARLKM